VTEQGEHESDALLVGLETIEGSPLGGGEGLATAGAAVALLRERMDADVALPDLAPDGTVGIVTELSERVHGADPFDAE